jgi:hypothetical protein
MNKKFEIVNLYRKLVNNKYYGISLRLTNLLDNYTHIGGDIKKITIDDHKVKFNVIYNNEDDPISVQLLTMDGSLQCGLILLDRENPDEAIFLFSLYEPSE